MSSIRGISPELARRAYESAQNQPKESSFAQKLGEMVGEVNELQKTSGELQSSAIRGEDVAVHDVMIASEQAGLAFSMMVEIRNKLVEAYQEIMRMQV
jgi:flagellar hook-basal body complex protein FliE